MTIIYRYLIHVGGPGSSVDIATGRSAIESRWGRDFPSNQTDPGAHPASCKMGTGSFPEVKCGRGVLLIPHPLLVPRSWKSRAIPPPTLRACNGITLPFIHVGKQPKKIFAITSNSWKIYSGRTCLVCNQMFEKRCHHNVFATVSFCNMEEMMRGSFHAPCSEFTTFSLCSIYYVCPTRW